MKQNQTIRTWRIISLRGKNSCQSGMKTRVWFELLELLCTLIAGGADLSETFDCHVITALKFLCSLMSFGRLSRGPTAALMQANQPNNCTLKSGMCTFCIREKIWRPEVIKKVEYQKLRCQNFLGILPQTYCHFPKILNMCVPVFVYWGQWCLS